VIYTVLVVDDSNFFQHRLTEIINEHPELNVVGVAANGQEAIDLDEKLRPDVISMDYEMPMLDGVSAIKAILAKRKVPIIMFSSLTYEGARITLDALDAGAVDFISKNFSEISQRSSRLKKQLHSTLLAFAKQNKSSTSSPPIASSPIPEKNRQSGIGSDQKSETTFNRNVTELNEITDANLKAKNQFTAPEVVRINRHSDIPTASKRAYSSEATNPSWSASKAVPDSTTQIVRRPSSARILIIGASTGGPVAVHQVLDALPANFPLPIVVVQHMPANFTRALAERLNRVCALAVREAESGDELRPGLVLVAPGGKQIIFDAHKKGIVKLMEGDDRMSYKPSLDIAFVSAANVFEHHLMGIVLTGMGSDGRDGAKILKQKGGSLWSQDQASCVVYGMPKAVVDAGLSDNVLTPQDMGEALKRGE
jgi:two-component system chemotaxis response regulator CheB